MSPSFETVRVAAVQATPVVLDAEASVEKACRLLGEAAEKGARLAVLPEAFVPLYPSGAWAHDAGSFSGWGRAFTRSGSNCMPRRASTSSGSCSAPVTRSFSI